MPVGNLGSDWTLHISDVFFARALRDSKMLLWASSTGERDFGGTMQVSGPHLDTESM